MKNGVLVCIGKAELKNIGDYIQSIAAMQFSGRDAVRVERESLDTYSGGPTRLIMNAWFMNNPERFPPSADILPLFQSFHVRPLIEDRFFTEATTAYLKAHGPVGCRSTEVAELMRRHGIEAEFSSCVTLTLGNLYRHGEPCGRPVFVDPYFKRVPAKMTLRACLKIAVRHLRRMPRLLPKFRTLHALASKFRVFKYWPHNQFLLARWVHAMEFYWMYSTAFSDETLAGAEYVTHKVPRAEHPTEVSLFDLADELLKRYEKASFVVTSRLHCALPCLAMGTPCWTVLPSEKLQGGRFGGNVEFLTVVEKGADGRLVPPASGRIGLSDAPPVKSDHVPYARELERRCREFMSGRDGGNASKAEKERWK